MAATSASCATTPVSPPSGRSPRLDPAYERDQVELNAVAVHDLTLAVLPGMLARKSGAILMVGSAAGNMPIPNNATVRSHQGVREHLRGIVAR